MLKNFIYENNVLNIKGTLCLRNKLIFHDLEIENMGFVR
jgi:hypothetical protein